MFEAMAMGGHFAHATPMMWWRDGSSRSVQDRRSCDQLSRKFHADAPADLETTLRANGMQWAAFVVLRIFGCECRQIVARSDRMRFNGIPEGE